MRASALVKHLSSVMVIAILSGERYARIGGKRWQRCRPRFSAAAGDTGDADRLTLPDCPGKRGGTGERQRQPARSTPVHLGEDDSTGGGRYTWRRN